MNRCALEGHMTGRGKIATCCMIDEDPPRCVTCMDFRGGQKCYLDGSPTAHKKPANKIDLYGRGTAKSGEMTTKK